MTLTKDLEILTDQKVAMKTMMELESEASAEARMITLGETSSANIVIKLTCHTQPCTLIWSKSTPRVQMASLGTHQLVDEVEADQEKIHTRDLTQGQKTFSRLQREKEALWIHCVAFKKFTQRSFPTHRPLTLLSLKSRCRNILFSST